MPARAMLTTRPITRAECSWLDRDIPATELLYVCNLPTYGCVTGCGVAATHDPGGGYPFFEVPAEAVRYVGVD